MRYPSNIVLLFPLLLFGIVGSACVEEDEEIIPKGNTSVITGTSYFDGSGHLTIQEGQDVTLVPGAQGGFHVWLSIRIKGVDGPVYIDRQEIIILLSN